MACTTNNHEDSYLTWKLKPLPHLSLHSLQTSKSTPIHAPTMAISQEPLLAPHNRRPSAASQNAMDSFINTQLQPVECCIVCTEPFSATHQPVVLPCKHIFGQECIKKWLRSGRGNTSSCPNCRHVIFSNKKPTTPAFDTPSIWKALCEQRPGRLHIFMTHLWTGLQDLWKQHPSGSFSVTALLETAILPALLTTSAETRTHDAFSDCYNLLAASWDSLGRPNIAIGLAVPLVRLARLMTGASSTLPRWLTTVPRTNRLIWRANACFDLNTDAISWAALADAAAGAESHVALLHLYTMLVSQSIAHSPPPGDGAGLRRHEVTNLVVERCCVKVGGHCWTGRPSSAFKDTLVGVFEELCRYQIEKGRMSLRGHDGEEVIVRGVWAMAAWAKGCTTAA
jgi:hypothetical protein